MKRSDLFVLMVRKLRVKQVTARHLQSHLWRDGLSFSVLTIDGVFLRLRRMRGQFVAGFILTVVIAAWMGLASASATFIDMPLTYSFSQEGGYKFTFSFPYIQSDDRLVARKINDALHLTILNVAPPQRRGSKSIEIADDAVTSFALPESGGVTLTNQGRVVVVQVFWRGAGAESINGGSSYSFDARTGHTIVGRDLFTSVGLTSLAHEIAKARRIKIQQAIDQERSNPTSNRAGDFIRIYQECLRTRFPEGHVGHGAVEIPEIMTLRDAMVIFEMPPCSSLADRGQDGLGLIANAFPAEALKPYLTPYGRYILLGDGNGVLDTPAEINQVYWGKIGGAISMTLYFGADSLLVGNTRTIGAKYYYDKYRKVIKLSVVKRGDVFELTEIDSAETPKPVLKFTIKGAKLVGHWQGGGKTLSFEAAQ